MFDVVFIYSSFFILNWSISFRLFLFVCYCCCCCCFVVVVVVVVDDVALLLLLLLH